MLYDRFTLNIPTGNIPDITFDSLPEETQNRLTQYYLQAVSEGSHSYPNGDTIVHKIVHLHSDRLFRIIFKDGCPLLNTPNSAGTTPLLDAIMCDDEKLLIELLKRDVADSINYPNKDGITPLLAAVSIGKLRYVKLLLKHGARLSVDMPEGSHFTSPLHLAATLEDTAIFKLLLKHGGKDLFTQKDFRQLTPFQRAIISNRVETVKLMLLEMPELAKTLNEFDSSGMTNLERGARSGSKMFSLLFAHCKDTTIELNPNFFAENMKNCLVKTNSDTIPIDKVAFPLIVAQSFCNVMVGLKDGTVFTVPNADGKQIRKMLMEKKFGVHEEKSNTLALYLNPTHAFLRLKCHHCDQGKPYNLNKGFYPLNFKGEMGIMGAKVGSAFGKISYGGIDGAFLSVPLTMITAITEVMFYHFLGKRPGRVGNDDFSESESDVHNLLKIDFYLDDPQAKTALNTIQNIESSCNEQDASCMFSLTGSNCIDFMQKVFKSSGSDGHFASYLSAEQLSYERTGNYALTRSRGVEFFLKYSFGSMGQKVYQALTPLLGPDLGLFTESSQTNQTKDIDEVYNTEQGLLPAYQFNLCDSIMLGAFLIKAAADTYHFMSDLWVKTVGEKTSADELSEWLNEQKEILRVAKRALKLISNQMSWMEIHQKISGLEDEALNKTENECKKFRDSYIDLLFDGIELEDKLKFFEKRKFLPTKNYLKKLKKKIEKFSSDCKNFTKKADLPEQEIEANKEMVMALTY
jgi:Ankyrin repeats (3 copies)